MKLDAADGVSQQAVTRRWIIMNEITVQTVAEAGVVGAGGAGFPTHVKLSAKADTVILNAAECEPLLHKDKELLRQHSDEILAGLAAAKRLVGAEQIFVGIKRKYEDLTSLVQSKCTPDMHVALLHDTYPAGDEFTLVYNVLGRVVPPGGLPLNVGVIVINVETTFNVALSPKVHVTRKYLTVAGAVRNPVTVAAPIGAPLSACLQAAGGPAVEKPGYIVGGVMMGHFHDTLEGLIVDKTTGGIVVLPENHVVVRRRRLDYRGIVRIGRSACDQCSFCTELCPRYILGHPIEPHRAMRSLMFNLVGEADILGSAFCCECNLCSLYACPEDLDPKQVCVQNKRRLAAEKKRWNNPPFNPRRADTHVMNRKAPMGRLMVKLGLTGFRNVGPLLPTFPSVRKVGIKLKQHLGAPCEPCVAPGREVRAGDVVGRPGTTDGKASLGCPVHASIDGMVASVSDGIVWIEG